MKRFLKLSIAGALACTMAGCESRASSGKKTVTINVAIAPDYAPYESLNKQGKIVGFDADMIKLFPSYLNTSTTTYKFKYNQMSFDNIITQLQANQADVGISGFSYNKKRKVSWSTPYAATAQMAVVNKGSGIKTLKDLEGKKLAAQTGSTGEEAAKKVKGATVSSVSNAQENFPALKAKQFDAVIVELAVAKKYAKAQGFDIMPQSLKDEKNYIVAKQGNTKMINLMNKALKKFLASKDYKRLTDKYGLKPLEE